MDVDLRRKIDTVQDGVRKTAETVHDKTNEFHENYVSDKIPDTGKYGDAAKFAAEMIPGVAEYNAIREGDWVTFAITAGIDVAAIAAGAFTAGAGYAAIKAGTKAGAKVVTKEVAKAATKKAVKEVVEAGTEKAVKESAETGLKKATKEVVETGAEKVVKESLETGTESVTKNSVDAGVEKTIKESSELLREGGSYRDVKRYSEGITQDVEVHHMPAKSSSFLDEMDGPAIRMEKLDHQQTASWGPSAEARTYRKAQQELIENGKFREAIQMDIDDITEKFGHKYDDAIKQMLQYVDELEMGGKI